MTPEQQAALAAALQQAKEREAKATAGPWTLCPESLYIFGPDGVMIAEIRGFGADLPQEDNGKFLAASRQLIPTLRQAVEDLQAELMAATIALDIDEYSTNAQSQKTMLTIQQENAALREVVKEADALLEESRIQWGSFCYPKPDGFFHRCTPADVDTFLAWEQKFTARKKLDAPDAGREGEKP